MKSSHLQITHGDSSLTPMTSLVFVCRGREPPNIRSRHCQELVAVFLVWLLVHQSDSFSTLLLVSRCGPNSSSDRIYETLCLTLVSLGLLLYLPVQVRFYRRTYVWDYVFLRRLRDLSLLPTSCLSFPLSKSTSATTSSVPSFRHPKQENKVWVHASLN